MNERRRIAQLLTLLASSVWAVAALAQVGDETVTGTVTDGTDPIEGAIVCGMDWDQDGRVAMPEEDCTVTGPDGTFSVETLFFDYQSDRIGQITAGADGFLNFDAFLTDEQLTDVPMELLPLDEPDNPDYAWWNPWGDDTIFGCRTCHISLADQWAESRHAIAAQDPWVLDMYNGTSEDGEDGVGPGYRLDHDDVGPCGGCHAATASWEEGGIVDMNEIPAEHRDGVYCETCHKISDVDPNGEGGVGGSITMWRPDPRFEIEPGSYIQFAFGPYPNVLGHSMTSSYSPLFKTAQLCSGCHEWSNAQGVPVMDTYTDWLAVGNPEETAPCPRCHMHDNLVEDFEPMEWAVDDGYTGGEPIRAMSAMRRDPDTVFRHDFYSGIKLAPYAMMITLEAEQEGNEVVVRTTTINVGANHRVPTGMPIREMILVVEVEPASGDPLTLASGPTIAPRGGDLAGAPGTVFAKSLGDEDGELTFAFWDATQTLEDTRLAPGEAREDEFRFAVDRAGEATVRARLLYRRASKLLADEKGWETEDQEIGLEEQSLELEYEAVDAGAPDAGTTEPDDEGTCACRQPGASSGPRSVATLGGAALFVCLVRLGARRRRVAR
ncbi:MAG: hypothetical protein HYY06_24665 [Deltaproteobacteria bacterium]|nr:hypothetical protein [Deltaproteobacteria bacterium]